MVTRKKKLVTRLSLLFHATCNGKTDVILFVASRFLFKLRFWECAALFSLSVLRDMKQLYLLVSIRPPPNMHTQRQRVGGGFRHYLTADNASLLLSTSRAVKVDAER